MNEGPLPAVPPEDSVPPVLSSRPKSVARWRRVVALLLLTLYIAMPLIIGAARRPGDEAILPPNVSGILLLSATELLLFGAVFLLALWLSRFRARELRLGWRGGWWALPVSLGWSVALRVGVGIILGIGIMVWHLLSGDSVNDVKALRPQVEAMVNVDALRQPLYLFLMLTLVSFILAGFREELWRAGMLALLASLVPRWFAGRLGPWLAILPVALLFGLGHTAQGPAGVLLTTLLGVGLGAILVFHDSIWTAVLAHGFFNASTFAILPLIADHYPELLH